MSAHSTAIVVLYVEDDARLGRLTTTYLERHGLSVHLVDSGETALADIDALQPDAVVLDVMLPAMDGHEVCRRIRERRDIPIIMVSALDEEVDLVMGLTTGADDYVTKPFSSRELLARIKAQVRRARGDLVSAPQVHTVGPLMVDEGAHTATLHGQRLDLTSAEFALLCVFVHRRGRVLSRDQLLTLTRQRGDEVFERAIDVQISRLRHKLGDDARDPTWIRTVRGAGYVLSSP